MSLPASEVKSPGLKLIHSLSTGFHLGGVVNQLRKLILHGDLRRTLFNFLRVSVSLSEVHTDSSSCLRGLVLALGLRIIKFNRFLLNNLDTPGWLVRRMQKLLVLFRRVIPTFTTSSFSILFKNACLFVK